ncbi:MAG: M48 family metalloprotease [Sandaracinaceae bacterium]|nr:M48 family metalloprotease [Sandaracinaceae bacterium]
MSDYGAQLAEILGSHVWFGPLLSWPLLGATIGFVWTVLLSWPQKRRAPGPEVHWSLRSSWAQGCRAVALQSGLVAVMTVGFLALYTTEPLGLLASVLTVLSMAAAAAGAQLAFRALHPSLTTARTARERLADLAFGPGTLYYWAIAPLVWAPFVTSAFDNQTGMVLTLAITLHFAWGFAALPLWHSLGLLTAPTPEVEALIRETAERAQTPLRRVMVWRWRTANAFAFPLSNDIALTERLVEILDPEELRAVALHELAHLREPRRIHLMRLCVSVAPLSLLLLRPTVVSQGILATLGLLGALVVVSLLGARTMHRAEHAADAGAHEGHTSPAYARALEKLHQDRLLPAVMPGGGQKSHPDLYDRMLAAGVGPDFPRPPPPANGSSVLSFFVLVVTFALVGFAAGTARSSVGNAADMTSAAWLVTPSAEDLLSLDPNSTEEPTRALVELGLVTSRDPDAWYSRAWDLAVMGDCTGAAVLTRAAERVGQHDEEFAALHAQLTQLPGCSE